MCIRDRLWPNSDLFACRKYPFLWFMGIWRRWFDECPASFARYAGTLYHRRKRGRILYPVSNQLFFGYVSVRFRLLPPHPAGALTVLSCEHYLFYSLNVYYFCPPEYYSGGFFSLKFGVIFILTAQIFPTLFGHSSIDCQTIYIYSDGRRR